MKIAYGTYAMPETPLEEVISLLSSIGYDGIEVCISPRHVGSMPADVDASRRRNLRALLEGHDLGIPALFMTGHMLNEDDSEHQSNLEHTRRTVQFARDLGMQENPVLSMGIGGKTDRWLDVRDLAVSRFADFAELGKAEGFIMAGEAHCGAAVDRSERALWLVDSVNSPHARLHFDIVHFYLSGEKEDEAVHRLLPITAHTHITDARKHPDGSFDLLLLGDGDLDATAYVAAMNEGGWNSYITLEVSARVCGRDDYDPVSAAQYSYESLSSAFTAAAVPRG